MKLLVGYDGSNSAKEALALAITQAKAFDATIEVITSLEGGSVTEAVEIQYAREDLEAAESMVKKQGISVNTHLLVRGMNPVRTLPNSLSTIAVGHHFHWGQAAIQGRQTPVWLQRTIHHPQSALSGYDRQVVNRVRRIRLWSGRPGCNLRAHKNMMEKQDHRASNDTGADKPSGWPNLGRLDPSTQNRRKQRACPMA